MKLGLCCGCFRFEECNMPFVTLRFHLTGFLLVLCRFFAVLASFLLVPFWFSVSFLLVFFFRGFLQGLGRCSALCLLCGAFGEYHSLMQDAVPGVIDNHSKWGLKRSILSNTHVKHDQGCFKRRLGRRVASGTLFWISSPTRFSMFRRHLVDFWCPRAP